jgi:hypothetical protein
MKCLYCFGKGIIRVDDGDAGKLVDAGKAVYVPKRAWKDKDRYLNDVALAYVGAVMSGRVFVDDIQVQVRGCL